MAMVICPPSGKQSAIHYYEHANTKIWIFSELQTVGRFSNTVNVDGNTSTVTVFDFALAPRCCHSTHATSMQSPRSVNKFKNQSEKYTV